MMERDVNLKFVYIILVLLLALAGTTVFYQVKYENMKSGYERSFEEMNHTLNDIMMKQKGLNHNISDINASATREVALAAKLEVANELMAKHAVSVARLQENIERLKADVENNEPKSVILQDINDIQKELNLL